MAAFFRVALVTFLHLCSNLPVFSQPRPYLVKGATIIDVRNGQLVKGMVVEIRDGRIASIGDPQMVERKYKGQVIDATGLYMMPGLWDNHMHFGGGDTLIEENKWLLPLYLAHGVTAVRDCAADISPSVLQWRELINQGNLQGPRIFTSGPKLEGINSIWKGDLEVGTKAEMLTALDSLQKLKVDFVKITDNTMKPDLYLEAIKATRARGWKITGHIPASLTLTEVSDAGLSAIEHMTYLLRAGAPDEKLVAKLASEGKLQGRAMNVYLLENFDTARASSLFARLAANGTAVVPTLVISHNGAYFDKEDHSGDDYLQYIGNGLKRTYEWRVQRAAQDSPEAIYLRHQVFEKAAALLPLVQKSGMKIIAGTDAGYLNSYDYPGIGLHQELAYYVQYGLTPLEAIQASVVNGPAFMGRSTDYGSVEKGKVADLLLLSANPLDDITNTQKISAIIRNGVYIDRKQMDKMLEEIKAKVKAGQ
ncbi:amidohydrolase family protein [Flavihumibacter rivuli]|uniref:amidohydrolase family protein n=1 Tax=Flavihumibacter rivuli TaxID=2838156 RepID=UPI001BDF5BED|nr:amidohydrolase family protein [Flavihumibacter rivuli]ULQ57379.1 amidohydrolase family protein [Flavihumibacter rivuli]